jgi:hypothetical protein
MPGIFFRIKTFAPAFGHRVLWRKSRRAAGNRAGRPDRAGPGLGAFAAR